MKILIRNLEVGEPTLRIIVPRESRGYIFTSIKAATMTSDRAKPTRWQRFRAVIIWVPVFLLTLWYGLPKLYWTYQTWGLPDAGDPFDVTEFLAVDISDDENARLDYDAAVATLTPIRGDDENLYEVLRNGWNSATPEVRAWLDENRDALRMWQRGTEKSKFLFVEPKSLSMEISFEGLGGYRTLARLAALEASRLLANGQHAEAWEWTRAILRSSRHMGQHGAMIERLTGAALFMLGIEQGLAIAEDSSVTVDLLRRMLEETTAIYEQTPPPSTALKAEYILTMNNLRDAGAQIGWNPGLGANYVRGDLHVSRLLIKQYAANLLDQIDLPMNERLPRTGKFELFRRQLNKVYPPDELPPHLIETYADRSTFFSISIPGWQLFDSMLREKARYRAFLVCLALRIDYLENERYPLELKELVEKDIVDEIPLDPYSQTGEPMHYRRTADGAIVYSIGPNNEDDGGAIEETSLAHGLLDIGLKLGDSVEAKKP